MIKRLQIALLLLLFPAFVEAQTQSELIQNRIEYISEQLELEEIDLTDVVEQLTYYLERPLNLNSATAEKLRSIQLLTDIQINNLLLHRKQFGKLISIYELQSLKYWDMGTIELVLPFVRVSDRLDQLSVSLKEALKYGKFEAYLRYQTLAEPKAGYAKVPDSIKKLSSKYYYGNADKYYTKLRYSYRTNLSVGITAEKDPGEQFFKGAQKNGFDFYSAHAYYKGGKYLRAVALGDYQIQIGQGLNLWGGYAFGKTADVTNIKKNAQALKPYTSVDENRFFRGAAVDLGYNNWGLTLFGSHKRTDASVVADSLFEELEYVSSINITGFHRTTSEIEKRKNLRETIAGGNLRYEKRNFTLGAAVVYQGYDRAYNKAILPYNQFDFRDKSTTSISADYSYVWRNVNLFGEASHAGYGVETAFLQGLIIALDSRASFSVLYRNYSRGYQTFYNNAFSDGSKTQNESGIYFGFKIKLSDAWSLNAYYDLFQQPWLKYQVNAPSNGSEFLIQPSYRPSRKMEVYGRFRMRLRQKNSRNNDGTILELEDVVQRNYRVNLAYQVTEAIQLKTRLEYVTINRPSNTPEQGMLFTQDVIIKPKSSPFDFALRYALFDTDSYDSRLYTFETNALYVYSIPAYYYQGSRAYAMVRYTFLRKFDLWVRYGTFIYSNRKDLGTGAEKISGNRKSDITVQLRIKF